MSEVLPSLVRAAVSVLEDADLDVVASRAGLPAIDRALRGAPERVPWDEYATMLNRIGARLSPLEQELLGERYTGFVPELRALAQLALSPARMTKVSIRMTSVVWPHVRATQAWTSEQDVIIDAEIPAPYLPCPFWIRGTVGILRSLPRLMGLPDTEVEHDLGERRGHYRLHVPSSGTLVARARRAIDAGELTVLVDHPVSYTHLTLPTICSV